VYTELVSEEKLQAPTISVTKLNSLNLGQRLMWCPKPLRICNRDLRMSGEKTQVLRCSEPVTEKEVHQFSCSPAGQSQLHTTKQSTGLQRHGRNMSITCSRIGRGFAC
jgi:hypothetical protein